MTGKRNFVSRDVREAVGRILRDQPFAGDGFLLLEALENVVETVEPRAPDTCALQVEYGRRKLAHDLIQIGKEEFERVHAASEGSDSSVTGRSGSASGATRASAGSSPSAARSRRRGPARTFVPDQA